MRVFSESPMVSFGAIAKRLPTSGAEWSIQFRNMHPGS